jgi:hypothetical protein
VRQHVLLGKRKPLWSHGSHINPVVTICTTCFNGNSAFWSHTVSVHFIWFSVLTAIISLNSVNRLIFVTVKCGVFFAVRTECLNIILTRFGHVRQIHTQTHWAVSCRTINWYLINALSLILLTVQHSKLLTFLNTLITEYKQRYQTSVLS